MDVYFAIVDWLHLLATAAWIGGLIFYVLILLPSLRALEPPQAGRIVGAITRRYVPINWGAVIVLIATGILIALRRGVLRVELASTYGVLLFVKHLVILSMIIIGLVISLGIGPKLKPPVQQSEGQPSGPPAGIPAEVKRLQKMAGALAYTNLFLGVGVLFLTAALKAI
jgi:uncharacterized membrane protein